MNSKYDANEVYTDIRGLGEGEIRKLVDWYKENLRSFDIVKSMESICEDINHLPYLGMDFVDDIWTVRSADSLVQNRFVPAKELLQHINGNDDDLWFVAVIRETPDYVVDIVTGWRSDVYGFDPIVVKGKESAIKEAEARAKSNPTYTVKIGQFSESCKHSTIVWE